MSYNMEDPHDFLTNISGQVRVKVCGITNIEDAEFTAESGADALGFIFWEKSPRYVSPKSVGQIIGGLAPFVVPVGVFVDEPYDVIAAACDISGIRAVQLHGDESPELCTMVVEKLGRPVIKVFRMRTISDTGLMREYIGRCSAFLLDTFQQGVPGGTGKSFDWEIAVEAKKNGRIILSGGLKPENIAFAVQKVMPYAVDVSSGVEKEPGKKDIMKVSRFIKSAKDALSK